MTDARTRYDWQDDAACAEIGTDLWFPEQGTLAAGREAKRICGECPVRAQCFETFKSEEFGIFGGTTAWEREHVALSELGLRVA